MAIIDTLEFQRLRELYQLGITHFVYPGATQSRFEHSLGTAHLGKMFILEIARHQPELAITPREIRCVEIAGLCHDLGHGPFSHLWERFYKRGCALHGVVSHWHHEDTSVRILHHLLERNRILERFPDLINQEDVQMIENMIYGKVPTLCTRRFLYQIINNPDSGLDVDKWDYFYRDAQNLGVKIDFEYKQILRDVAVLPCDGDLQICFRDKSFELILEAFCNRKKLHKKAYQHPKTVIIEEMVITSLLQIEKEGRENFWATTAAVACDNPSASCLENFVQLTDLRVCLALKQIPLYQAILARSTDNLMYRYAGTLLTDVIPEEHFEAVLNKHNLVSEDVAILRIAIHMGKHNRNPMDFVRFFKKGAQSAANISSANEVRAAEIAFIVVLRYTDREKLRRLKMVVGEYGSEFNFQVEY